MALASLMANTRERRHNARVRCLNLRGGLAAARKARPCRQRSLIAQRNFPVIFETRTLIGGQKATSPQPLRPMMCPGLGRCRPVIFPVNSPPNRKKERLREGLPFGSVRRVEVCPADAGGSRAFAVSSGAPRDQRSRNGVPRSAQNKRARPVCRSGPSDVGACSQLAFLKPCTCCRC